MPDADFDDPRLALLYGILDPDRSDLEEYAGMVAELDARSVLDVGCGTGTFALLLAEQRIAVTGVDPAGASLDVARGKPGAGQVTWIHGDATTLPPLQVDVATMTANVAQVLLTDDAWDQTLCAVHAALRPGGYMVFETRVPERRAWESWGEGRSTTEEPGPGPVTEWMQILDVGEDPLLVSFVAHNEFPDGQDIVSHWTLRFRSQAELNDSLERAGFSIDEVRGAPDRPGASGSMLLAARYPPIDWRVSRWRAQWAYIRDMTSANIEQKVRQLDTDVQAIYEMLSTISSTQMRHTNRLPEISEDLAAHTGCLDSLDAKVDVLDGKFDVLNGKVDALDGKVDRVLDLLQR